MMQESGLNDGTFIGANSNISFEELSSKQENESLRGTFPARSIYSGRNHVANSEAQSEQVKNVDMRAPDISVNFKNTGAQSMKRGDYLAEAQTQKAQERPLPNKFSRESNETLPLP